MLHYEKTAPQIVTTADKERVLDDLRKRHCSNYKKGDVVSINEIAKHYPTAIENGIWSLKRIEDELGEITDDDDDERIRRLFITDQTFSNVHEGIEYLVQLMNRKK